MKIPEGERLDDALDMWHNDSWDCPGGKPELSGEQLAHGLMVMEPWFRDEYFVPRRQYREPRPKKAQKLPSRPVRGSSSEVPEEIRVAVLKRDGDACTRCGAAIVRPYYSLQHRRPRGMGGSRLLHTMANLVTLCGSATTGCHGEVESDRETSTRLGWLVPHGVTPEQWPVWRWTADGHRWEQPGDTWELAVPHERQRDLGGAA